LHLACAIAGFAAVPVVLGWALSPFHLLTPGVYLPLLLSVLLLSLIWMFLGSRRMTVHRGLPRRFIARLRHPLPFIFFIAVLLGVAGGLIHSPNNYDALSYRIPRVLAWISDGGWSWIPTTNDRMNFSGTVQEWLFYPLIMTFQSDRMLFVLNLVSFALMPGLVFSLFRGLGIHPRVAWWWMWLVPLGMGIVLQAGGIGNDLLGVLFFLVAADSAVRFRRTGSSSLLFCSILSIGLCTGVKLSNLPLMLPWLALLAPAWMRIFRQGWRVLLIASFSALVSILPTLALNRVNTGSWTGDPNNRYQLGLHDPIAGVVGNSVMIAANTLAPPILPFANQIEALANSLPPFRSDSWLSQRFPNFHILLNELPQEEATGPGLLVVILLVWSMIQSDRPASSLSNTTTHGIPRQHASLFFAAYAVATLCFLAVLGSDYAARLFLPYTPPLIAFALWLRDPSRLVRTPQWRLVASSFGVAALVVVVLSPSRPLFPVNTFVEALSAHGPASLAERVSTVYSTYARRADAFASVRGDLTSEDTALGFLSSGNDLETSLWRPFASRKIVHVLPTSSLSELASLGVNKVLISDRAVKSMPVASQSRLAWLLEGRVLKTYRIRQFASQDEDLFILVSLDLPTE